MQAVDATDLLSVKLHPFVFFSTPDAIAQVITDLVGSLAESSRFC